MKTRTLTKAEKQNWKPLRNVAAVSYTHLDVYKRQEYRHT